MSKKVIRQKINDTFLRKALGNFAAQYPAARERAFDGEDFTALRDRISAAREASLQLLPELVASGARFVVSAAESLILLVVKDL